MTTPFNTITSLLPHLTAEQLQTIEATVAWYCRQNLTNSIAALPNASLSSIGIYVEAVANPRSFINAMAGINVPPAPVVENAVPTPFQSDLLPPLPLTPPAAAKQHQQHPQLKSPEPDEPCECFSCASTRSFNGITCRGCLDGEWGEEAHMGHGGCNEHKNK